MEYQDLNIEWNTRQITRLLELLYIDCLNANSLWYSKTYDVKEIYTILKEFNETVKDWEISSVDENNIIWSCNYNKDSITITNDENVYNNALGKYNGALIIL